MKKLGKFMNRHINERSPALPPWGHLMIASCITFEQWSLIPCCVARVDPKEWPLVSFRYLLLRMILIIIIIIIITWGWESVSFRWMFGVTWVTWEWFSFASICSYRLSCGLSCGKHEGKGRKLSAYIMRVRIYLRISTSKPFLWNLSISLDFSILCVL